MPRASIRVSWIATCLMVVLSGCGAPQDEASNAAPATPTGSSTSSEQTATPIGPDPTLPPALQGIVPEDIFTAPADPLTVAASADAKRSVTQSIGSAGGEITATGADGSTYTLTIPEGALPFDFAITMSPVAGLESVEELGATSTLGVMLSPDGLVLATPATLTIKPPSALPNAEVGAITFQGSGQETELTVFDQSAGTITMAIPHFSGWVVMSPFDIDSFRPTLRNKFFTQDQIEARLRSEIAGLLGKIRQAQELGIQPLYTVIEVARMALGPFKRLVISPRVAIADRGCKEANDAITAYLEYQQQRQLLGVGDDPEFALVGAGLFVPEALIDLAVQVCFKQAYEHCKATGEFPQLAVYYLSFFRKIDILGAVPEPEHIQLAQDYLKRCGRWRVKVATTLIEDDRPAALYDDHEATREFFAEWKASDGPFGIIGSTVEGHGPVETTKLDRTAHCHTVVSDLKSIEDAAANITKLLFEPFQSPLVEPGKPPAVPKELSLTVGLGEVDYTYTCPPHGAIEDVDQRFDWSNILALRAQGVEPGLEFYQSLQDGTARATFGDKGWRFASGRFKATLVQEDTYYPAAPKKVYSIYVRNEVIVEHEPQ